MNAYIFECPPMDNDPSVIVIAAESTEQAIKILNESAYYPDSFSLQETVDSTTKVGVVYNTHTLK